MKILIIEDEPEIADDIKQYFMSNGIQCEKAKNYREAIERINMYSYDCILLDLKLPDGEGFEILKELKTLQKEEGIIIVSAQEALESRIKGLNLGADDYVTKPFHISELFARTLSVIRRKKFLGYNVVSFNEITIDIFDKSVNFFIFYF